MVQRRGAKSHPRPDPQQCPSKKKEVRKTLLEPWGDFLEMVYGDIIPQSTQEFPQANAENFPGRECGLVIQRILESDCLSSNPHTAIYKLRDFGPLLNLSLGLFFPLENRDKTST